MEKMNYNTSTISLENTGQFSKLILDFVAENEKTKCLYDFHFTSFDFENYLKSSNFSHVNRKLLVDELLLQNKNNQLSVASKANIEALNSNTTFTVTTGHQLCLFTGPLFFIYKIITVINFCEELNKKHPKHRFVPVYWMASEDHDFEEVNHAYVFGKKIAWQSNQKGKVGDFNLNDIQPVLSELKQILGTTDRAEEVYRLVENCYQKANLADAMRTLVNELFGKYGLVIIDADSKQLKSCFIDELKKDIFENAAHKAVSETNEYLVSSGYSTQVNPREINVFYADKNIRERIEYKNNKYCVNNTPIEFSKEELLSKLHSETEKFSPNVILRPLYQQKILPNIAYIGGPGEIAYWLQYKKMFEVFNLPFPLLQLRRFAMLIDKNSLLKLEKLNVSIEDLFLSSDALTKKLISSETKEIQLSQAKEQLTLLFESIKKTASEIDKSLAGTVDAELQKAIKNVEIIEQKIIRAIKTKNETAINQLKNLKAKFFPENTAQERHDNFLPFYVNNKSFIEDIKLEFSKIDSSKPLYLLIKDE